MKCDASQKIAPSLCVYNSEYTPENAVIRIFDGLSGRRALLYDRRLIKNINMYK